MNNMTQEGRDLWEEGGGGRGACSELTQAPLLKTVYTGPHEYCNDIMSHYFTLITAKNRRLNGLSCRREVLKLAKYT